MSKLYNGFPSSLTEGGKGYLYSVFMFVVLLRNGISAKNLLITNTLFYFFPRALMMKKRFYTFNT